MQCECRNEVEAKVRERIEATLPEGFADYHARLDSYGFAMMGNQMTTRLMIPYQGEVMVPKKAGGMKKQKIKMSVAATYCPFCGKRAVAEDPASEEA